MRQIFKNQDYINQFNAWAKAKRLKDWNDFSVGRHTEYEIVREYIAKVEQENLSAYTEKPLDYPTETHIDHFRKRNLYPKLTFNYSNFLVDDKNDNYGARYKDNHAKVKKETFDGTNRIFCAVTENMADFIEFTVNGTIIPKTNLSGSIVNRIKETIRVFNLNHKTLKVKRENIIIQIRNFKRGGLLENEIRTYVQPYGFPSVINWALSVL